MHLFLQSFNSQLSLCTYVTHYCSFAYGRINCHLLTTTITVFNFFKHENVLFYPDKTDDKS